MARTSESPRQRHLESDDVSYSRSDIHILNYLPIEALVIAESSLKPYVNKTNENITAPVYKTIDSTGDVGVPTNKYRVSTRLVISDQPS